jgi:outer membrane protein OmpA-like peptidoglycan-associated protein
MQTNTELVEGARTKPEAVISQIKLLRATERAQDGDLEAALVLLSQIQPTLAAIDLRARIELQRGNPENARALWNEVLEKSPGYASAKKGLRALDHAASRGRVWRRYALIAAPVLLGVAGLAVFLPSVVKKAQEAAAVPESILQPTAAAERAASQPAVQPSEPAANPVVEQPAAVPDIELPAGVTAHGDGHARSYLFDDALFSEGVRVTAGARERLTALGRALEPHLDTIAIELVGHVDSNPESDDRRFNDNTELALSRANAVLGRLVRTTHISAERFALRAAGEHPGPFEDVRPDTRNRTVEIRVQPLRQP